MAACASHPPPAPPVPYPAQPEKSDPPPQPKTQSKSESAPRLKQDHPIRYVVKKGDTLWDISKRFLDSPWLWPDIWYVNPQIRNPHLIYPGDVIELRWVNGKPRLTLAGAGNPPSETTRLHPEIRSEPIEEAIPTIPIARIRPFLTRAGVVTEDQLDNAPYVVATGDGRLLAGAHHNVYVRGLDKAGSDNWLLIRKGDALIDPKSGDTLGYKAIFVGAGKVAQRTEPVTFTVTDTTKGVRAGDYLIPRTNAAPPVNFYPHAPEQSVDGEIISVPEHVKAVGQYDVVVVDRGKNAGIDPGTVLGIYQQGREVDDPHDGGDVTLPTRRVGLLMVFRTFDKVSYGLILELKKEVHVLDPVKKP